MKRSEATMQAICENLIAGLSYPGAARAAGISARSFWGWIKASQSGEPDYELDFLGERVPFHRAVTGARRIMLHNVRSEFEKRSYLGHDEIYYFQGQISWQVEPRCVGLSEDVRELLGFRRDGLREVTGEIVPNMIHHEPPIAAVLRVLEVGFPGEYIPTSKSNITQTVNGTVGIAMAKPLTGPPPIPPAPIPPPQLEILPDDIALAELLGEDDIDADDFEEPEEMVSAPVAAPAPDPIMIAEPSPPEYAPAVAPLIKPRRELSALERDLLTRASAIPGALDRRKA